MSGDLVSRKPVDISLLLEISGLAKPVCVVSARTGEGGGARGGGSAIMTDTHLFGVLAPRITGERTN